ncbi:MAG TPA: PIN domain-containing protein [Vicinamibacterales bacterium]|nr:PIN domain-containing protein [Vicinamibacterales bacterium]
MSIPTAVFLDTSILDGQQYNFESTALSTFVPVCKERGLKLLLPEPTEKEIERHIRQRSSDALAALADARRKAPFLAKWPGLPPASAKSESVERLQVYGIARREWHAFLKQFNVVKLGYEGLDVKKVMLWYETTTAPFREGKKRKEFPDAFSIAMLEAYAAKEKLHVAVVSADPDLKAACQRFNSLLHFQSLPRLTELLLSEDARVEKMRSAIDAQIEVLLEAIAEAMQGVSYYHEDESVEVYDVDFGEITTVEPSIVAIGDNECTISFYTALTPRVTLRFYHETEHGSEPGEITERDDVELEGTAKMSFDDQGKVAAVTLVSFNETEVRLRVSPWRRW